MEVMDAIRGRRSIRVFRESPVDRATVERLLQAATYAPSRMNTQPWHFHVATGAARKRVAEIMALTTQYLEEYIDTLTPEELEFAARFYADLGGAPVVVGVSTPHDDDRLRATDASIGVGAAVQNVALAATAEGLGVCTLSLSEWILDKLTFAFEIPAGRNLLLLLLLGHADETPHPKDRHADVVTYLE